jgi:hypothetical protein
MAFEAERGGAVIRGTEHKRQSKARLAAFARLLRGPVEVDELQRAGWDCGELVEKMARVIWPAGWSVYVMLQRDEEPPGA